MNQQKPDTRNLFLAVALCMVILIAWDYFILSPRQNAERQKLKAQETQLSAPAPTAADPAARSDPGQEPRPGQAAPTTAIIPRAQALALSGQRIVFDTPSIDGSIAATGARIDNLMLKAYRETVDPNSPEIVLLTPKGSELSYFAEFGWTSTGTSARDLPASQTTWTIQGSNRLSPGNPVTLTWDNDQGLKFTRIIAVDTHFMFTIADTVQNTSSQTVSIYPYAIIQRNGLPKDHVPNWVLHEGMVGVLKDQLAQETYADIAEAKEVKVESKGGWLGVTDKYWMTALIPPQSETIQARFAAIPGAGPTQYQADYLLSVRTIPAGGQASVEHKFFAGAKVRERIAEYEEKFSIPRFHNAIDWGWFWFLTQPIFWAVEQLNKLFGNFGVAILALTVIVKALFFPLANRSYEAMSKLKKVQPEMKSLQETYKDDRGKLQQEMMALYRREKINPMMGCLPIIIQIPVFFSLYKVLFVTIEMRHAPFFGWIQDLAAPDPTSIFNLFGLLPFGIPPWLSFGFIHIPLHIGVWAILMGVTMWLQTKMNPPAQDPMQQQMLDWMPWIFMLMLTTFPAGLLIYWVWNNILSIGQQYVIMRRNGTPIEVIDNFKLPAWLKPGGDPPKAGG